MREQRPFQVRIENDPIQLKSCLGKMSCSCACTSTATSSSFLPSCRHRRCSFMISYWRGGVKWGGTITFILLRTHRHGNLIILPAPVQTQALQFHDQLPAGRGEAGWDNNDHVPVHTQAPQPYHPSCSRADTGTALSWSVTGGVGWGGVAH